MSFYHIFSRKNWIILAMVITLSLPLSATLGQTEDPLLVCVSTPDLKSLANAVGGNLVKVTAFCKGPEDPHVVEVRTSMVTALNQADLLIEVGLGCEDAWLIPLMNRTKNPNILPKQKGRLNLAKYIKRLEEGDGPDAVEDSTHEEGNPHYLLDPVEGLKAAKAICDKLIALRPEQKTAFEENHLKFVSDWAEIYFGKKVAKAIKLESLEDFASEEELAKTLQSIMDKHREHLDGILGMMLPHAKAKIVGDHDLWPYFARRFDLDVIIYLEERPSIPPTTKHLSKVIKEMKKDNVSVILTAPYFAMRHAEFVAKQTDATIVRMAHQTEAHPEADTYLNMLAFNASQLAKALKE